MIAALADLLEPGAVSDGDGIAVVGHGGVGTLWWCHLAGESIARRHDQPRGGCLYSVDLNHGRPNGPWVAFED